jgi:hypothetical protein
MAYGAVALAACNSQIFRVDFPNTLGFVGIQQGQQVIKRGLAGGYPFKRTIKLPRACKSG